MLYLNCTQYLMCSHDYTHSNSHCSIIIMKCHKIHLYDFSEMCVQLMYSSLVVSFHILRYPISREKEK